MSERTNDRRDDLLPEAQTQRARAMGPEAMTMLGGLAARLGPAALQRKLLQRRQQTARQQEAQTDSAATPAQDVASLGTAGPGSSLPHLAAIQASFGHHDLSGVRAHTDGAAASAAAALHAEAYATGNDVAFGGAPSLHTAAHEAAHVVQQRAGVHLKGGVGQEGDDYERHADAVADCVVRGASAEALLDQKAAPGGGAHQGPVQLLKLDGKEVADDKLPALVGLGPKKLKLATASQEALDYVMRFPAEQRDLLSAKDIKERNPNPALKPPGSEEARLEAEGRREKEDAFQAEIARLGEIEVAKPPHKEGSKIAEGMAAFRSLEEKNDQEIEEKRKARRTVPEILQEEAPVLRTHHAEGKWQNGESDLGVFGFPGGTEIHIHFKHNSKQIHKAHTRGTAEIDLFRSDVATRAADIPGWQGQVLKKCCALIDLG